MQVLQNRHKQIFEIQLASENLKKAAKHKEENEVKAAVEAHKTNSMAAVGMKLDKCDIREDEDITDRLSFAKYHPVIDIP